MSQIHILDGQNDLILDYVQADDIVDDDHRKSLEDTLETYEFIAKGERSYTEHLGKRNRLIIPDEDGSLVEFVIFEAPKYNDSEGRKVQVFAHASYLELRKAGIIYPDLKGKKRTASQHAGFALNDTGWQVGTVEASGEKTLSISEHTSPYEFLKHIAKEYGVELRFRVEHNGKQITGRYVDLLQRVGEWRGREVEFGRDLDGIRRVEKQDIVTALLGLGPEQENGTRIEVLVEDFDALERWGRVDEHGNLKHLIEPYEIESERTEMTETEARRYTKTALNKRINTQVTYECTIVDLENVPGLENEKIRFGDTIRIKDTSFVPPLYLEARVFEQERSIKTTAKKDIKLGDFVEYTEEDVNAVWKQLKEQIKNRVSYYEMVEYTYDKLTIDDKDETYFEEGKSFAEAVGIEAKGHADFVASNAEANAKDFAIIQDALIKAAAEGYADSKAQSALDQAKMYSVAKTVYENKMKEIAEDIGKKAPIEYVDGQLRHAIDGLVIGGRNLARETSEIPRTVTIGQYGYSGLLKVPIDGVLVSHGDQVTFSIYVEDIPDGESVYARLDWFKPDGTYDSVAYAIGKTSNNGRIQITAKVTSDTAYTEIRGRVMPYLWSKNYNVKISSEKLEKGNKATDWTPAPEDMFSEIEKKADGSTVYTIEQVDNKFNNYVGITQYTTDQAEIVQGFLDFGTRIAQNETAIGLKADDTKVNQINNSLTQKIGNVEVKADEVFTRVSEVKAEVDGLEIGGRNFIRNSDVYLTDVKYVSHTFSPENEVLISPEDMESGPFTISVDIDVKNATKGTYTGRVGAELSVAYTDGENAWFGAWLKIPDTPITNKLRLSATFPKVTKKISHIRSFGIYIQCIGDSMTVGRPKVEKGNKATDWTPAPEDTDAAISDVKGRVETAEGEIRTLAGEVIAKASKTVVDSLEKRVTSAEGELKVLPGEINAKVSKDGIIGALNLTPETALIDFKRVKMTGELEAKHIKSLKGLNINDQFIVDANGKVTIGNQRVTIDDKGIQIRRPDGAVAVDNGLMHNAYSVSGNDPHYMKRGKATGGATSPFYFKAFQEYSGSTFIGYKGMLDGRGDPNDFQTYSDVRDTNTNGIVFQRYEYIHSARYFVVSLQVASGAGAFAVMLFNDGSDNLTSRVYYKRIESTFSGEQLCIVDIGKPTYSRKEMHMKFGWTHGMGPASEKIEFRVQRVIQTDFI
ncbi:hypothetical protein D5F11_011485 [Siminovitchia terrae]|uniref:Tail spike domain-containing protein n=1 Tax=Siminovitchia terrae TaxID=1914933 RepID=A0A429X8G8_SIMTE|nr:phage tail spike protein [Siminovitchia terrae]RST59717.1 hypothetical protein D5F11_011485 [Siminovitchia terrae]